MRVLLLTHEYPPLGSGAGLGTHALARSLAAQGSAVDVVTAGPRHERESELHWDGVAALEGLLTVHRVRPSRPGALGFVGAALPVARRLLGAERHDVVHVLGSLPAGAMLPLIDLRGTPVIVSLRGPEVPGYDPRNRPSGATRQVLRPLVRLIWRRADRIVVPCDALGRLARRTWPELRYAVIPHGVDLARFRPRLRHRSRGRVRCLAVASLVERSGLAHLVRAIGLQERGQVELEIVGVGPGERSLRLLAAELGVADLVTFAGRLDPAAVAQRFREADLFTLVRAEESVGMVFAEAMASGLPIVGAASGALAELVRDGYHGALVAPDDLQALAGAIRRLAASPRARAEMGRRNRAHAEEHLCLERVTARHLTIYNGVQRRVPARPLVAEQPSSIW